MTKTRSFNFVSQPGCSSWPDVTDNTQLMPPPPPKVARLSPPQTRQPSLFCDEVSPWSVAPNEVLINAFKYLNDQDRCSAALVCKKWFHISRAASLWRRRHFIFDGMDAEQRLQRHKTFITLLGQHVQHVTLVFGRPTMNTAGFIVKAFEGFVSKVNSKTCMRLRSISIRNLDAQAAWRFFSHHRGKLVRSLCTLFRRQAYLRRVKLPFSQFNKDEGLRVLESLAFTGTIHKHHKQLLTHLDLQEFFSNRTRVHSSPHFAEIMEQLTALTSLCIDKRYLNEEVLERLTSQTKGAPLRHLQLIADSLDAVLDHPIRQVAWGAAAKRNPYLKVEVRFRGLGSYERYSGVLVRGMPLTKLRLSWLGTMGPVLPSVLADVGMMLHYVAYTFSTTITHIQVCLCPEAAISVDDALVTLVSRCPLLQELFVTCKVSPSTLDKIQAVLASRQGSELQTMELRLPHGFTEEMTSPEYIQRRWPGIRSMKILT